MNNFYLTLAIAIAALFLRVHNRPIFHRSVYDSADAEYTRRNHFQEPIVNAGQDLSVSHTSRRSLGDAGEHFVDISYDGLLRGDVPIVKLDNILSLERVTCFENREFLSIELEFSSSEELVLSRHLLARGNLLVAGHQWECAHSRGAIALAKIDSVNDDKTSSAKCLITAQHIEYNDIFTHLRLEFSTNAYADRNQGIIRREAIMSESPSCPGFSDIDVDFKDDAILSTFFNILNQAEQVTAGLKAAVVGLATLKDSFSSEWNDNGVSFSATLGMNYNELTGNATCEIPLAELGGAPLLNCRNCYAYATATLYMSIDITGGQFNQLEVKLLGETGLKVELELDQTAALTRTMKEDLVSNYALSAPITFAVGPIPVFIIPTSSITVGAVSEMEQEDNYAVIVSQVNDATLGAGYDGNFYTIKEFNIGVPQAFFRQPSQDIEITAGAYVDVELLLQVNYLGGPTISLRPFAELLLQSASDQEEYCQIQHSSGYMAGVDWGLSVVVGAEFSPPFLGDELKVPLAKQLVFYEPIRDFCLVPDPINPFVGEPLLHHSSWVGTMVSCLPDLQGQVVKVEVIYRTLRDGIAEFEIVYNDPCTGIGFFDADPVNTPNQTGVRLTPSRLTLSLEGAEPDAFCKPQEDVYNEYDFEQTDQPSVSDDVLEELTLTFTNDWENIELLGECTTIQATFGREPWLDAAAGTLTCYWLSFVPFVAAFVAAFV